MKHISILVPVGSVIIDTIIAPYNLLKMANTYYKKIHGLKEDLFKIDLVGLNRKPVQYQQLFQVTPTKAIDEITNTDLIIVTAISGNLERAIERNADFVPWIKKLRIENDAEPDGEFGAPQRNFPVVSGFPIPYLLWVLTVRQS